LSFHGTYEDSFHEAARHDGRAFGIMMYDQFRGKSWYELQSQFLGLNDENVDTEVKIEVREDGVD
jgi:hypothetical protein